MNDRKKTVQQKKQYIVLDSCVIQFALNKYLSPNLSKYLRSLIKAGFLLAISEISYFELFHGATLRQEKELNDALRLFIRYRTDLPALIAASRLGGLYRNLKIPDQQISVGDKIIAATSVLTGSLVLTANYNDFPRPFFREVEAKHIFFKKKNRDRMVIFYLLFPDFVEIGKRFSERS